jgi:hypothetical protein
LKSHPDLPQVFSTGVAHFISDLLIEILELRLGGGEKEAEELK